MSKEAPVLTRRNDQVLAKRDGEWIPVTLVWARPVSGRGEEMCVLDKERKEVAMVAALDAFSGESRQIAAEELEKRYLIPRIRRVTLTMAHFGSRYWEVDTNCGAKRFMVKDPNVSVVWVTPDHMIVKDTMGNRYEIESLAALDNWSRQQIDRVL